MAPTIRLRPPRSEASRFRCLRSHATTEIALTGITAKVLSDDGTCAEAPKADSRQPCSEPYPGLEVLLSARILRRGREQDFQSQVPD